MPSAIAFQATKMAVEASYVLAPPASGWWQGGRWHDVVLSEPNTYQDRQEVTFQRGEAQRRTVYGRPPFVSRRWSEGEVRSVFQDGVGGLLLHGILGRAPAVTANAATLIMDTEPVNTNPKAFVLTGQPTNGAVLRLGVTGTASSGTIGVSGLDINSNGASELISFASAGIFYTRRSYTAVGASGVAVSGITNGSLIVYRVRDWTFTYDQTVSEASATLAMEVFGNPLTGSAASSQMFTGLVVKRLTIETDAEDMNGLMTISADLEGLSGNACPKSGDVGGASFVRLWPGWSLEVMRDNSSWLRVARSTVTIETDNRNLRPGADSISPQGAYSGWQTVSGELDVILEDAAEYNRWLGASNSELVLNWNSPWRTTTTRRMELKMTATCAYTDNYEFREQDGIHMLKTSFRVLRATANATNDYFAMSLRMPYPGTALGAGVI